ncbi:MAG: bifunctional phosphoribosyl-AMP cyclohydrolase/phosphoribosyl-ATP diphosphatase HisIE [Candidatus Methanoplasma sp.]|jgi:phosphoribosyl-ATP pyrophosphohydrolase/phosphoribosyl-AMP cyclohydrolase|nr:bifunctional phosphoribosyl-AMP cyclohydrolase/phosphoribosyl-ATP diphosphatase HisIE [Candidatus Methanoplasma sp.]
MTELRFDKDGLMPAVIQDHITNEVLMVAWVSKEAFELMKSTGQTHFWSRSRQKLWRKGEESGHVQEIVSIQTDCDADTLLVRVKQTGPACHTGSPSCFYETIGGSPDETMNTVVELGRVLKDRLENPKEGSYTCLLYSDENKMYKKIVEEAGEFVLAMKDGDNEEAAWELADLMYHIMVAVTKSGLPMEKVYEKLAERKK